MEFPENLDQFGETHYEPIFLSESDYDENENSHSDEESGSTSDKESTSKDPNNSLAASINVLIEKLQKCCLCQEKCSEKVPLTLLQSLALESIVMGKKKRYHSISILLATSNPNLHEKTAKFAKNYQLSYFVDKVKLFIKSFGDQYGEKQAVRKYTRKKKDGQITINYEKDDIILLSSHYSYNRLLYLYNSINQESCISGWTFRRLWKNDAKLSKIVIRKPSKDVCDECTLYKRAFKESRNKVDEGLDEQLVNHVTDYQVHQFGLVDEGIDKHWHAIYTKGKESKEPNEVTSMLHHFFVSVTGEAEEINAELVNLCPRELPSKGLPEEKQVDFWNKIRQYYDVVMSVEKLKGGRAKEAQ
ncbi:2590_t:CDS:2, partial [Racocetra fulgida]